MATKHRYDEVAYELFSSYVSPNYPDYTEDRNTRLHGLPYMVVSMTF